MHVASILFGLWALVFSYHAAAVGHGSSSLVDRQVDNIFNETELTEDAHGYNFHEFYPRDDPISSFRQPYFHFKILFRKNAVVTEDFFHRHWKTVHADLTLSQVDFALRLQRYTQFHQDEENRNKAQELITAIGGAMQLAPYDAIAEFHTKDYQTWERFILSVFADPLLVGDQQKFVDTSAPLHIMAGYDNLIFGSGINTSRGYDGVLPEDCRFKYSNTSD